MLFIVILIAAAAAGYVFRARIATALPTFTAAAKSAVALVRSKLSKSAPKA